MTRTLKIVGMSCNHCVMAVTKALQAVPGVEAVSVSLERGDAVITGDAEPATLIAAVQNEGYEAETA